MRTEMAHPIPTKVFPKLSPEMSMLLHPLDAPTHLLVSCPFCWRRTYLQKMCQVVS